MPNDAVRHARHACVRMQLAASSSAPSVRPLRCLAARAPAARHRAVGGCQLTATNEALLAARRTEEGGPHHRSRFRRSSFSTTAHNNNQPTNDGARTHGPACCTDDGPAWLANRTPQGAPTGLARRRLRRGSINRSRLPNERRQTDTNLLRAFSVAIRESVRFTLGPSSLHGLFHKLIYSVRENTIVVGLDMIQDLVRIKVVSRGFSTAVGRLFVRVVCVPYTGSGDSNRW